MMKMLIIKLTSMGDLIHALPAITDAVNVNSDVEFDWVVDEAFAEVPLWHPRVKNVIKTAHRQWRKSPLTAWRDGKLTKFYQTLKTQDYDMIIDMQSNLKSALVSWICNGDVHGLDKQSCREYPAHWAYTWRHTVNSQQHTVEKLRQLMASALCYEKPASPFDYGVDLTRYPLPQLSFTLPERYIMCVHNASWTTKLWPPSSWKALVTQIVGEGYSVLLPCGNDREYSRAKEIAAVSSHAFALPKLSLNHMAALMVGAKAAVCSDTGLAHLAAVAGVPAITLYGVTHPERIGTQGDNQHHIISDLLIPSANKKAEHTGMHSITVKQVYRKLDILLSDLNA